MSRRIPTPFADSGDRTAVPNDSQTDGRVNYADGYGAQYSLDIQSNPNARRVERNQNNQLWHDVTSFVMETQERLYPDYITPAENGGTAVSYNQGVIVRFNNTTRISLDNNNTTAPDNNSMWADAFPLPVSLGGTGAENAADARQNLGITEGGGGSVFTLINSNLNLEAGERYRIEGNFTPVLPNTASDGQEILILINTNQGALSGPSRTIDGVDRTSVSFADITPGALRCVWSQARSRWDLYLVEVDPMTRVPSFTLLTTPGTTTYNRPDGSQGLIFIAVGGGGGGASGSSSGGSASNGAGGGGAGAGYSALISSPAASYSVTVGDGGDGGVSTGGASPAAGQNGELTTVTGVISASGGDGALSTNQPGAGGAVSGSGVTGFTGITGGVSANNFGGNINASFETSLEQFLRGQALPGDFVSNVLANLPTSTGGTAQGSAGQDGNDGTNGGAGSGGGNSAISGDTGGDGGNGYILVVEF